MRKMKDVHFITLATLKHGSNWDSTAHIFNMKFSTFEGVAGHFIYAISEMCYTMFV